MPIILPRPIPHPSTRRNRPHPSTSPMSSSPSSLQSKSTHLPRSLASTPGKHTMNTASASAAALRPGSSVPRKNNKNPLSSLDKLDWRSEVYLDDFPRSLPVSAKVTMVEPAGFARPAATSPVADVDETKGRVEVGLEGLIEQSKGKREKRATTATTLGFDFVPNPSTIVLSDSVTEATPSTPTLLCTKDEAGEDEEDDEDWEHVDIGDANKDDQDDAVIVFGELELDDPEEGGLVLVDEGTKAPKRGVSYAAALAKVNV